MPLVTITTLKGRTLDEKKGISSSIHEALTSTGIPEADLFQRFLDMDAENFLYDKYYPNLETPRSDKFMIIEILFSVGRNIKIKRQILKFIVERLNELSLANPNDVFVSFQETSWENWSFANGEILHG